MPRLLACPSCQDAREREMSTPYKPSICPKCSALFMLHQRPVPHLVLFCRWCHEVFEGGLGHIGPVQ